MKCHVEELVLAGTLFHGVLDQKAEKKVILFPIALYHSSSTLSHVFWFSSCTWSILKLPFFKDTSFDFFLHEMGDLKKNRIAVKEIFLQKTIFLILFLNSCRISGLASCYEFWMVSQGVCVYSWSVLFPHVIGWIISLLKWDHKLRWIKITSNINDNKAL